MEFTGKKIKGEKAKISFFGYKCLSPVIVSCVKVLNLQKGVSNIANKVRELASNWQGIISHKTTLKDTYSAVYFGGFAVQGKED